MAFYTAAVGAQQQQQRLNVQGNNIANANTYGFKAEKPSFAALMYGNIQGIDNAALPRGTGVRMIQANTNYDAGSIAETGRPLDYSIIGPGFFALLNPTTQEISYTRDGSFSISGFQRPNENGEQEQVWMLSDGHGRFVLDAENNPIEVTDSAEYQPVAVFDFDHTDGMIPVGSNLFQPVEKNGAPTLVEDAVVYQSKLETSNTDMAEELTKVIEAQRSYSYALRMVQTSDEVTNTINGLRG